jgi:HSP20 family protein
MAKTEIEKNKNQQSAVTRREQKHTYMPATDIRETPDAVVMQFDMPGVSKENVDINLDRDMLAVTGKVEQSEEANLLYQEYHVGDYYREFTLSDDLNKDKITAQINAGVLTLTIPKSEKTKAQKIQISGGD